MKRSKPWTWIAAPLAAALLLGAATLPLAASPTYAASTAAAWTSKILMIKVDGKTLQVPGGVSAEGDTYIGLRFLADELGLTTTWDSKTKIITTSSPTKTITMQDQSTEFKVNGHRISGKPVIVKNGSAYLPLRFLLEQMGYEIVYNHKEQLITINPIVENSLILSNKDIDHSTSDRHFAIQYPQLSGMSEPEAQGKINSFLEKQAKEFEQAGKELFAQSSSIDLIEGTQLYYDVNYTITYNQDGKLSIVFDHYEFTGGAHGNYGKQGFTFDLNSGKVLTLQEAALNNSRYKQIINTQIKQELTKRGYDMLEPFETISDDQGFYLRGDKIIVFFSLYEYTPYSEGMPEFSIPLELFR